MGRGDSLKSQNSMSLDKFVLATNLFDSLHAQLNYCGRNDKFYLVCHGLCSVTDIYTGYTNTATYLHNSTMK